MNTNKKASYEKFKVWLSLNTSSLDGKSVAITGSTGGLGKELARYVAHLGASVVLVDRNLTRSSALKEELIQEFSGVTVECVTADLSDMTSVKLAAEKLSKMKIDIFIHNAGAYSIPRKVCDTGFDNVFQINFVSPYYLIRTLLPGISKLNGKVVVVGSIAHAYSKTDKDNVDFKNVKAASKVYGNAKRYLMFSLYNLFKNEKYATLSVTHPGITFTGITAHYPKLIFAIIKHPMKIIFMKPEKAALSILKGLFDHTDNNEWIGPRVFNVWGLPNKKTLKTVSPEESEYIGNKAEEIYKILV